MKKPGTAGRTDILHREVDECVLALAAVSFLVNGITACYHEHRKKKEGTGVL